MDKPTGHYQIPGSENPGPRKNCTNAQHFMDGVPKGKSAKIRRTFDKEISTKRRLSKLFTIAAMTGGGF